MGLQDYKKIVDREGIFFMVHGQEAVTLMEFILPSMCIATINDLEDFFIVEEIFSQSVHLEEDQFVTGFHQQVQKEREKSWHDRHLKKQISSMRLSITL
jgi:hypothetical protein